MGWGRLRNGDLLTAAEGEFDVLVTADQNLKYQQNLRGRRLAIVALPTPRWAVIKTLASAIASAVEASKPGDYIEIPMP